MRYGTNKLLCAGGELKELLLHVYYVPQNLTAYIYLRYLGDPML